MVLGAAAVLAGPALAQDAPVPGMIVSGPPQDFVMEVRAGDDGTPVLSQSEFKLVQGSYYRFNFSCPEVTGDDEPGFHLEVTDLLANSHLRVIEVNDMEVYMQGLTFRALECDASGTATFSFYPIRKGTYGIYVRDHSEPPKEARGTITVE